MSRSPECSPAGHRRPGDALPNAGDYVEYSIERTPWTDHLFEPALQVRDGRVAIPDGPGWGVRINPELIASCRREVSEL